MRDSRRKACPNPSCEVHEKKMKIGAKEKYCKQCGAALVFVCKKCGKEIVDEGPEHKICPTCQAEIADRKERAKEVAVKIGQRVAAVATIVIPAKLKDVVPAITETAPEVIDALKK